MPSTLRTRHSRPWPDSPIFGSNVASLILSLLVKGSAGGLRRACRSNSGRHLPAGLGAAPAGLHALLHAADLLAGAGALVADFGAFAAGVLVVVRPNQHEVGGGLAHLGAGQHEPEVLRLDVLAARLEAVVHRHAQAGRVAAQALL